VEIVEKEFDTQVEVEEDEVEEIEEVEEIKEEVEEMVEKEETKKGETNIEEERRNLLEDQIEEEEERGENVGGEDPRMMLYEVPMSLMVEGEENKLEVNVPVRENQSLEEAATVFCHSQPGAGEGSECAREVLPHLRSFSEQRGGE